MKYVRSIPGSGGVEYEEATYEGSFKAGKREGFGTMTWQCGSQFTGIWKNDMRHEGDMMMVPQGITYRGFFKDDLFHGLGMLLIERDEVIFEGQF